MGARREGDYARGAENGNARLDERSVRALRLLHERYGLGCRRIAAITALPRQTVYRVITRQSWAHVP